MGPHGDSGLQLESADLVITHAGCPALRLVAASSSFNQPNSACCQFSAAIFVAREGNGFVWAELFCRRSLCNPSAARGIGRLGFRAQGSIEHAVLLADSLGLR